MSSESPSASVSESINVDQVVNKCLRSAARATASSNAVPGEKKQDWDYYSTFPGYMRVMGVERAKIEELMNKVLSWSGIKAKTGDVRSPADLIELLTDANDQILERINIHLDEASGIKKDADPLLVSVSTSSRAISGSWNKRKSSEFKGDAKSSQSAGVKLLTAKNVSRPQLAFKDFINNTESPFEPRLQEKPHSRKPLSILIEYAEDGTEFFSHPYLFELDMLRPQDAQLQRSNVDGKPKSLEESDCILVDTADKLKAMIAELKAQPVVALDTEAHRYRSYLGITSLVQLSSPDKDWIVDPYPIWSEMTLLNELFADPKIVKVIHGADNDVLWLQRDFSVYLVNLFDTHIAAKVLNFPAGSRSYAFLLYHYCGVKADKQYQLADWRIRPLPEEMIRYARTDTRYLIHVYNLMKNALIENGNENNNLLRSTLDSSTELCKRRFCKPVLTPTSHMALLRRSGIFFNSRQLHALKALYQWRDKAAREEDESEAYVLPDHMLLKICGELPREMQGILACCNPTPPLVKQNLQHVHLQILKAREQPLTSAPGVDIETARNSASAMTQMAKNDVNFMEDPIKCPLDLGPITELTGSSSRSFKHKSRTVATKSASSLALFSHDVRSGADSKSCSEKVRVFLSPYKRYQLLKPYLEHMNARSEQEAATTDDKIRSIREHFDSLTAMTAEEYSAPTEQEKRMDAESSESSSDSDGGATAASDILVQDPGNVKALRPTGPWPDEKYAFQLSADKKAAKKRKRKQKSFEQNKRSKSASNVNPALPQQTTPAAASGTIDYENADFSQFSATGKKQGNSADGQFNPFKNFHKNAKGGKGAGGKQKQRFRAGGGMSMSYKQK